MNDTGSKRSITGFWSGRIEGTNRGSILVRISGKSDRLRAKAIFHDQQLGITVADLVGDLSGERAEFHLLRVEGLAGLLPQQGQVTLTFKEDDTATGEWSSDVGTQGSVTVSRLRLGATDWLRRLLRTKLIFVCHKWLSELYALLLITIAIVSVVSHTLVSWPALVLLLVPLPFVFRSQLADLITVIHTARVRRIGPIEFDQNPPTAQVIAVATQQAHQTLAFAQLNGFFVLRTKILLAFLAHAGGMGIADFRNLARQFGVVEANIDITLAAIQQANCARVDGERLVPTEWGHRYVQFGLRLA